MTSAGRRPCDAHQPRMFLKGLRGYLLSYRRFFRTLEVVLEFRKNSETASWPKPLIFLYRYANTEIKDMSANAALRIRIRFACRLFRRRRVRSGNRRARMARDHVPDQTLVALVVARQRRRKGRHRHHAHEVFGSRARRSRSDHHLRREGLRRPISRLPLARMDGTLHLHP